MTPQALRIAVIGAGHVGGALASGWVRAGHHVVFGVRDVAAQDVRDVLAAIPGTTAADPRLAAQAAEVVVVAVPGGAVASLAQALGPLENRVVIDATNVVGKAGLPDGSGTAALREFTRSPHVVKCFNTTGFENMRDPRYGDQALDMFMAGSSAHGKTVAARLASNLGFSACHDVGGDDTVPLLEALALVWINLAIVQRQGRDIGLKMLRR